MRYNLKLHCLNFFDVISEKTFMWKHHLVCQSRPHNVTVTLINKLYMIKELDLAIVILEKLIKLFIYI
jgi:hypothetical protein